MVKRSKLNKKEADQEYMEATSEGLLYRTFSPQDKKVLWPFQGHKLRVKETYLEYPEQVLFKVLSLVKVSQVSLV